jgi:hypothetical protein
MPEVPIPRETQTSVPSAAETYQPGRANHYDANYMEAVMTVQKRVLVIGLDPTLIDFSQPGYPPGMDATKVFAGIKSSEDELTRRGYSVHTRLTDFGETAEAVVQSQLKQKRFDCILIGAGVRTNPSNFMLFEKLINVVHEHAPQAKICFNTLPSDIAAAVKRWL